MLKKVGVILGALAYTAFGGMTADQIDQILYGQNKARAEKGVGPLTWNSAAASVAQGYSDQCNWGHNPNRGNYGENIAAGSTPYQPYQANQGWIDGEYSGAWQCGQAISGSNYNHYSQVMWAATTSVGCGITYCTTNSPFGSGFPSWTYVVCDYSPPGNYMGQTPYPSSQCNSVTPCTPAKTCTEAGSSFQDSKCGQISCSGGSAPTPSPTSAPSNYAIVDAGGNLQNGWGSYVAQGAAHTFLGIGGTVNAASQSGQNYFFLSPPSNAKKGSYLSIKFNLAWQGTGSSSSAPNLYFFWNGQYAVSLSLAGSGQVKTFSASIPSGISSTSTLPLAVFWNAGSTPANIYVYNVYLSTSGSTGANDNTTETTDAPAFQNATKSGDATIIESNHASAHVAGVLLVLLATVLSVLF